MSAAEVYVIELEEATRKGALWREQQAVLLSSRRAILFHERRRPVTVRLLQSATNVQRKILDRGVFFSGELANPFALRRRLRWVILITCPNCSRTSCWIILLLVCGAWLHLDSRKFRTGSRALEGCPCLASTSAASPCLRYACHQR